MYNWPKKKPTKKQPPSPPKKNFSNCRWSYLDNWGTLYTQKITKFNSWYYLHLLGKTKIQVICISLIYVKLICKTIFFHLKNCRTYPDGRVALSAILSPKWLSLSAGIFCKYTICTILPENDEVQQLVFFCIIYQ